MNFKSIDVQLKKKKNKQFIFLKFIFLTFLSLNVEVRKYICIHEVLFSDKTPRFVS